MKHLLKFLSVSLCLFSLSACETVEGFKRDLSDVNFDKFTTASSVSGDPQSEFLIDGNCPQIQIVPDLGRVYEFAEGQTMITDNLISSAKMNEKQSTCTFNERSVTVDLKLAFYAELGPKGRRSPADNPSFSYPFFVAVTNGNGKILAKEIFAAPIAFAPNENQRRYNETLRQIIPADTRAQGAAYKVMIGFQLAEKQLQYNRTIIAAEILAEQQIELQRLEAARLENIKEKAEDNAQNVTTRPVAPQTTTVNTITIPTDANAPPEPIVVPQENRAGPFDIFKSEN